MDYKPYLIGLAGPTGVGKTNFAQMLSKTLGNEAVIISSDMYYKDQSNLPLEERKKTNMDRPEIIDHDLLVSHLENLKAGQTVQVPVYDFATHTRTNQTTSVAPQKVIIVEGLLVFSDKRLTDLFDLKIYLEADADLRLARRLLRDVAEKREETLEGAITQYLTSAYPSYKLYVAPQKELADLVIEWNEVNEKKVEEVADMVRGHLEH